MLEAIAVGPEPSDGVSVRNNMRQIQHLLTHILNENGNVAATFAIALVPLLGFVGAAVDYSRANGARSSMQVALDFTALMVSKDLGSNPKMSASEVSAKATGYFNALYTNTSSGPISVTAVFAPNSKDGSTVPLDGSGTVKTDFMRMVGFPQLGITASSTTTWGSTRMRVAMALDVTGSMQSAGKMAAMQSAAKNLIDTLSASARMTDDNLYIDRSFRADGECEPKQPKRQPA